jgi:hypothetical protein
MRISFGTCELEGLVTGFNDFSFNVDRYFVQSVRLSLTFFR